MWQIETDKTGKQEQYWTGRVAYDPKTPGVRRPHENIPIKENVLLWDPNAGQSPRAGGSGPGRFFGKDTLTETVSGLTHSLANLAWGQGGWRSVSCNAPADKQVAQITVKWSNVERSSLAGVMGLALNGAGQLPAWAYANACKVSTPKNGADYEWCHLLGHGLGGEDRSENIVAATHACNSEQLCIERWLRDKAARGVYCQVKIRAQVAKEGQHLAEGIAYSVYSPTGGLLHYKWLDGRRPVEPSITERDTVWQILETAYEKIVKKTV